MNSIKDSVSKSRKYINDNLRKEFLVACKDEDFCKLCNRFNISEDIIMKYTSHLQDSVMELNNCKGCKGINECKNKFKGRVYYPLVYNDSLEFEYKECKYSKSIKKLSGNCRRVSDRTDKRISGRSVFCPYVSPERTQKSK